MVINLSEISGLPLEYDENTGRLQSYELLLPRADEGRFHTIYRDVHHPADGQLFRDHRIRHDITILPPKNEDGVWAATPWIGEGMHIFEILNGTAHLNLQKFEGSKIKKNKLAIARPGNKVIIPKGYRVRAFNVSNETLIMSSIIKADVETPKYEEGFTHFASVRGEGVEFRKYEEYKDAPELEEHKIELDESIGPIKGKPMYLTLVSKPERFTFLHE